MAKVSADRARVVALDQIGKGSERRALSSFSPCGRRWRAAPDEGSLSAETNPSSVSLPLRASDPPSPTRGEGKGQPRLLTELLRRPRIKATRNRLLAAAAFWRDVEADDLWIGEQR